MLRISDDISLHIENNPDPDDFRRLAQGLLSFNVGRGATTDYDEFVVFLRNRRKVVGGVKGYVQWGWLFVSHLWVDEALRGQGWGTAVMRAAEREGRNRGCRAVHLDTFSFQAPGFYEKLGYTPFGVLHDYPNGHRRIFLWKPLA
jgi:ribosomal protein S18 acetylase RimI-like enzyme